ncbi:MAG: ATP synthase F1 subunit epsilon [Elusimicrobiota bacterium]
MINLLIISPEGTIFKDAVREATFPSVTGELTVLPGHTPVFTKLKEGEILIRKAGADVSIAVTGGFIEITQNAVNVLADYAVRSADIELEKEKQAQERARELLKTTKDKNETSFIEKELRKHILELKVGEKYKRRSKR